MAKLFDILSALKQGRRKEFKRKLLLSINLSDFRLIGRILKGRTTHNYVQVRSLSTKGNLIRNTKAILPRFGKCHPLSIKLLWLKFLDFISNHQLLIQSLIKDQTLEDSKTDLLPVIML